MQSMPAAEVEIDEVLVRSLLEAQAPALADRPLEFFGRGWDNTLYRLGDDLLVRLPHRESAVPFAQNEQRWLPELAERLPIPIPAPIVVGQPTAAFGWPWTVIPHVPGDDAIDLSLDAENATVLAAFCRALHQPAPDDAPPNPFRGGPIGDRAPQFEARLSVLPAWLRERQLDVADLRRAWERALDAPLHAGPPVWLHGDLHPGNVIVREGRIVSVIDFGDLTAGDRATDLGSAWMFFDQPERDRYRSELEVDDATWDRARGWATHVGVAIAESSADNSRYAGLAERILRRVAADTA